MSGLAEASLRRDREISGELRSGERRLQSFPGRLSAHRAGLPGPGHNGSPETAFPANSDRDSVSSDSALHTCIAATSQLNDAETVTWPVSITGREAYHRETLSIGDVSIVVYIHESLTPREALNLLVEHYKAWRVNRPGGRR